ncbi:molybdenum cofactor guanylyltransferase [Bacillus alkalicellulosilyticus]|uniref:molybdenum cofactor guanylyltransferase n=1 Tax=Alkalihalobacterium alkalicellulosilyticum TaxID=1912214 RepID=UPI0009984737|nr:molybdenum cofactor guanylyltransferase [Bacillus alkalicellulosilyticus]
MSVRKQLVSGVLLAGGESRRFGSPKAFHLFNEKPFYSYSYDALTPICHEIIIISHPAHQGLYEQNEFTVLVDDEKFRGKGPLAGIFTAMTHGSGDWFVVAPCDTPFITTDIYLSLLDVIDDANEYDVYIPDVVGKRQPLTAIYHKRCLPFIQKQLEKGVYKVGALFDNVNVKYITIRQSEAFRNMNTLEDIRKTTE